MSIWHSPLMVVGVAFALIAGLLWGLVFITPVWLPEYPPALLAAGRYLAFGLIALPLAWMDRTRLALLTRSDWVEALKLALVGNLLYYLALAAAIQRAGAPLPTMIIGTLPVVIAMSANLFGSEGERLSWRRLLPSLALMAAGIACVHRVEMQAVDHHQPPSLGLGIVLAIVAVVCWTIYPIRNARWLRAHRERSPSTWATAQGIATLPLALAAYAMVWAWQAFVGDGGSVGASVGASAGALGVGDVTTVTFAMPWGPRPWAFVLAMLTLGLLASWVGTMCWNQASQRLPSALSGQLIVFETLAALAYAYALRGHVPAQLTLVGAALLVAGVVWALRPGR